MDTPQLQAVLKGRYALHNIPKDELTPEDFYNHAKVCRENGYNDLAQNYEDLGNQLKRRLEEQNEKWN